MKTNRTTRPTHARAALALVAVCFALASCDQGTIPDTDKKENTKSPTTTTPTLPIPSDDASLSALALSPGTLSPVFSAGTISYAATVPNTTAGITVTPTSSAPSATIKGRVNGGSYTNLTSGTASGNLALNVGANTVEILVTAETGKTSTYAVTVTREQPSTTGLSALVLSAGTLSPVFSPSTISYATAVPNATSGIILTPTAGNPKGTVTVNGISCASGTASDTIPLVVGPNTITIATKDEFGKNPVTYAISVTRIGTVPKITLSFKYGVDGSSSYSNIYVAWIEKTDETVIQNLTVCKKLLDDLVPPSNTLTNTALPFWMFNRFNEAQVTLDGVTGATKGKQDFSVTRLLKDTSVSKFKVYFETDRSFDKNDWFGDQPALLYSADVDLDNPQSSYDLTLEAWTPNEGTKDTLKDYLGSLAAGARQTVMGFITHKKGTWVPPDTYAFGEANPDQSATCFVKGITLKVE